MCFISGLGEYICLQFAQAGSNVAINYVSSEERAKALADKIEKEHGVRAFLIQGVSFTSHPIQTSSNKNVQDMGKQEDCIRTVKEATQKLGGLDIIISNAVIHPFTIYPTC
jgi:NAD(P)-dependent dehydrogenase (short-subunit alcohol dehydrogenase family)